MKRVVLVALVCIVSILPAAFADAGSSLKAKPFVFDPDGTGIITATWMAGQGLPDTGASNRGLVLQKSGPTATNASGGVVIEGAESMTITELGFDVRADGHCGAGAPRFNLVDASGTLSFLGCNSGSVVTPDTPVAGWNRIRFPSAVGLIVSSLAIVFDEGTDTPQTGLVVTPGSVVIDNIQINEVTIGRPGNAP